MSNEFNAEKNSKLSDEELAQAMVARFIREFEMEPKRVMGRMFGEEAAYIMGCPSKN